MKKHLKTVAMLVFLLLVCWLCFGCSSSNDLSDTADTESTTSNDYDSTNTDATTDTTEDDLINDPEHQGQLEQDLDSYGDELRAENDTGNYSSNDEEIWQYCVDRWDYYDELEGGYSGDKYTDQVFADAASQFGISSSEAYQIWKSVEDKKLGL